MAASPPGPKTMGVLLAPAADLEEGRGPLGVLRDHRQGCGAVSDLSPLSGLSDLEELSIGGTGVSNLSPLSALTSLKKLEIHYGQVIDTSPLAGLLPRLQIDGL